MSFMTTYTGKRFYFDEPTTDMVDIEDIAHSLAMMPRFAGHTTYPYSVARHSIFCAKMAPNAFKLEALLHDATEAYIADIVTPVKNMMSQYKAMEQLIHYVIAEKFGMPVTMSPEVKEVDMRMLVTEARQVLRDFSWSYEPHFPDPYLGVSIKESSWEKDKEEFLYYFHRLKN